MSGSRRAPGQNAWIFWSVGTLVALLVASVLVGFVWLPSARKDVGPDGLWGLICRAAGAPSTWYQGLAAAPSHTVSDVVLTPDFLQRSDAAGIGRGATLAMQCTMCHGARGMSGAAAPNLAGQYPEVLYKQLHDYRGGQRSNVVMEALAKGLGEQDMRDLAAYYAFLPRASLAAAATSEAPALVRVGDPMRNIPPCASCHGGMERKVGTPWLEGTPALYLATQLQLFSTGARRNDISGQMRNVARHMTGEEIQGVSAYYAARPEGVGVGPAGTLP
ncbi:MAG: c-type cytochrome [Pseudomonadota bacterium]